MNDDVTNFPLSWPAMRPRTPYTKRRRALFRKGNKTWLSVADGCGRVLDELRLLGVSQAVISTNIRPTLSGIPRSGESMPADPGAAVYFTRKDRPYCLACDRWDRVADNLAAIAAEIAANRGRERWGVVTLEEAFEGFAALPEKPQWWQVLGLATPNITPDQLRKWFHELARTNHPDRGGDPSKMADQSAAYEEGLEALRRGAA